MESQVAALTNALASPEPVLGGFSASAVLGAVAIPLLILLLVWGMPHLLSSNDEPSYPTEPVWVPSVVAQPSSPVASPVASPTVAAKKPNASSVVTEVDAALSSSKKPSKPTGTTNTNTPSRKVTPTPRRPAASPAPMLTPRRPTPRQEPEEEAVDERSRHL